MKYVLPKKSDLKQIKVNDMSTGLPDLKNINESKVNVIAKWLMSKIDTDKNFKPDTLLPSKPDLAYLLGVSIGTIQNSLRLIEDLGYVQSKQCIGTIIRDRKNCEKSLRKLTSKRETAINTIKKYLIDNNYTTGQALPSARNISLAAGCSSNTTRLVLEFLKTAGIVEQNEKGLIIKSMEFDLENFAGENQTLVKKVENDLKDYIKNNFKTGDRIPAHSELSKELSASIKTVHDALKSLINEGILLARRGRYGTTVLKMPGDKNVSVKKETSIFAPAPEAAFYYYEKTQNHIKKMIAENYEIGSKLPSIAELAKKMDLSPNTIRKALNNLAKDGYLTFSRGRYGGTFVTDIPEEENYKWLSVNPKYAEVFKN